MIPFVKAAIVEQLQVILYDAHVLVNDSTIGYGIFIENMLIAVA